MLSKYGIRLIRVIILRSLWYIRVIMLGLFGLLQLLYQSCLSKLVAPLQTSLRNLHHSNKVTT